MHSFCLFITISLHFLLDRRRHLLDVYSFKEPNLISKVSPDPYISRFIPSSFTKIHNFIEFIYQRNVNKVSQQQQWTSGVSSIRLQASVFIQTFYSRSWLTKLLFSVKFFSHGTVMKNMQGCRPAGVIGCKTLNGINLAHKLLHIVSTVILFLYAKQFIC